MNLKPRDAYKWAVKNITSSKVQPMTVQKLEKAYQKAKPKGKIGIKKVSIPIMIKNQMRTDISYCFWIIFVGKFIFIEE